MVWSSPLMQMSLKSFCLDDSVDRALKFKYSLRTQTYLRLSLLSIHPKNNYKNNKFIFLVERSGNRKHVCVRRLIQMMLTSQVSLHISCSDTTPPPQASLSCFRERVGEWGEIREWQCWQWLDPPFFFVPSLVDRLLTVSVIVQKVLPVKDNLFTDRLLSL